MTTRWMNAVMFASLYLVGSPILALTQTEYVRLSAHEKQNYHQQEAIRTQYSRVPWRVTQLCGATIAGFGLGFRKYSENIMNWNAPAASTAWQLFRYFTGKPIHRYGVTASALVSLHAGTGVLGATNIPATIRYSLAGPHIPEVEQLLSSGLGNYHPGFMISFHVDGKPDLNLVIMPPNGLDGFYERVNPFGLVYTHKIENPQKWGVKLAADCTFSRFVTNPMSQELDAFASLSPEGNRVEIPEIPKQLYFHPQETHRIQFANLATRDDREIFTELASQFPYQFFDVYADGRTVGKVEVTSPFRLSRHGDQYYSTHPGFTPK